MIRSVAIKIFMWHACWRIHLHAAALTLQWAGEDQTQIHQMGSLNGEEI